MIDRRIFTQTLLGVLATAMTKGFSTQTIAETATGIDSHAHVSRRGLPVAPVHRYVPDYDALPQQFLDLLHAHGLGRGVLIQPSFLGTDNSYLLSALKAFPESFRGVVVIDPERDFDRLPELDRAGCVGIRLNLIGLPDLDLTTATWTKIFEWLRLLDWQVELQVEASRLQAMMEPLLRERVKIVIDHFGRPDPKLGVLDPGFRWLLDAGASRRVWVKLSGAYRNGANGVGQQIARDAMPLLRASFGLDRLVWGSDWPHTQMESLTNYDENYRLMLQLLPDERSRRTVLVDTPGDLFWIRSKTRLALKNTHIAPQPQA